MKCRALKGSLIVEASFLMPILILMLCGLLVLTINLYQSTARAADDLKSVEKVNGPEIFLRSAWLAGAKEVTHED